MRLKVTKSAHSTSYSIIKSAYIDGKRTSVLVEKLGNSNEIIARTGCTDPEAWARDYVEKINADAKEQKTESTYTFHQAVPLPMNQQRTYNGGYLFLQDIYYELGLDRISKAVKKKHSFSYNLNAILSRLIYTRVLYPSSKLSSFEQSRKFIEPSDFELQNIYRALSIIASDSDYIQSSLYRNSLAVSTRKTNIIYYDCTNFFFELEAADVDGLRQYGVSKEHRPTPIVQMGLFMDGEGIPLAFCINPGNTNEQTTLKPLEETLLQDFELSKFVVCTDAGLSSMNNRKFNNEGERAFVTTQSIKSMKKHLLNWSLDPDGWHLINDNKTYNLNEINEEECKTYVFFKERWINENGLEQHLIVTFSPKDKIYQRSIRANQIDRALSAIKKGVASVERKKQNDFKRLLSVKTYTPEGEIAEKRIIELDEEAIKQEERFDGFYAVCTNLEGDAASIIKINQHRWEIEDCFRVMKTEFKSRPVFLQRDDRIKAHFMICFIALTVFRYLEKKLDYKYTSHKIIETIKKMDFLKLEGHGYVPCYERTDLTDALHTAFGIDTSQEIIPITEMKKICAKTKK